MIALETLFLLALVDSMLAGLRSALGRDARIEKGDFFMREIGMGLVVGVSVLVGMFLVMAIVGEWNLYEDCARILLTTYIPYAFTLILCFLFWMIPIVDSKAILNVLIFGPLTFLRPFFILAGALWVSLVVEKASVVSLVWMGSLLVGFGVPTYLNSRLAGRFQFAFFH